MNVTGPAVVSREVTSVQFSVYSDDEIRRLSVKQITNPVLFDNLNHPTRNGLYDPALGPLDRNAACATCSLSYTACPGHPGHIELVVPVFNPNTFVTLFALLRGICPFCTGLKIAAHRAHKYEAMLKLMDVGLIVEALELYDMQYKKPSKAEREADSDAMEDDDDDGSEDAYIRKIDAYVRRVLREHRDGVRVASKSTHVHEQRRRLAAEFLKKLALPKCENCKNHCPTLRRDGYVKIFELPLSDRQQRSNETRSSTRADIFEADRRRVERSKKASAPAPDSDSSDVEEEPSDNESSEEDEVMEENDEQQEDQAGGAASRQASKKRLLTPMHARNLLKKAWEKDGKLLQLVLGSLNTGSRAGSRRAAQVNMFFLEVVPVPPTRFRPPSKFGANVFENPQNTHLTNILKANQVIAEMLPERLKKSTPDRDALAASAQFDLERAVRSWFQLQEHVNTLVDSTQNKDSKSVPAGIKQVLEKKEGLFRKHMMGKRVNFAARTVISPDPNIETSEIGIPLVFARRLTYPEPVTAYNVHQLRQAVINGPDVYPGATHIQQEDGSLSALSQFTYEQRVALASQLLTPQVQAGSRELGPMNKRVLRHLRNGDVLLVNRQPTLHKPSMMAHVARVLPGERTLRLHYANCNTYNADFDGDEMNVHFPQNELARAEAYLIANTDNQYLVPTDGKPLRGLIQDHIMLGTLMTMRDSFFTREEYQQLLFGSLPAGVTSYRTVPPCIIKPQPMWTGKQIITTILLNLTYGLPPMTLYSTSRIPARSWNHHRTNSKGPSPSGTPSGAAEEGTVVVFNGELLQGVLDKSHFGPTSFGFVHACYELYGATVAGRMLTALGRLFTRYGQRRAFSCRMDDLLLTVDGDATRARLLGNMSTLGHQVSAEFVGLSPAASPEAVAERLAIKLRDDREVQRLDAAMKGKTHENTSKILDQCLPEGQYNYFLHNNMSLMIHTGAKGSTVNLSQITCLLGQQELEGRRVPMMISGKTLPSFRPFDTSARAGGFIAQRFLTGIRPQEFFFHCMAGREGLIDTAVKTSRSGYLQRCLIKHMEGLRVHYDHTVRDADGSVLQFHYGEDSLDVTRHKYLTRFEFSARNYAALLEKYNPKAALAVVDQDRAPKYSRKVTKSAGALDPVLHKYDPSRYLGAVSESFERELEKYIEKNEQGLIVPDDGTPGLTARKFRALMHLRYLHSLVHAGEAVGVLAGQSIGEPSTQMTLNTFHFAGVGAANVTLGIPRLRELVMTASANIRTPLMTLPMREHVTQEQANAFARRLSRLTLSAILERVTVTETVREGTPAAPGRRREYLIRFNFVDPARFERESSLTVGELSAYVRDRLVRQLLMAIAKAMKASSREIKALQENVGEGTAADFGETAAAAATARGDDEESGARAADDDDEGAAASKRKKAAAADADSDDDDDNDDDESDDDDERRAARRKEHASYDTEEAREEEQQDAEGGARKADDLEAIEEVGAPATGAAPASRRRGGKAGATADREAVLAISTHVADYHFDESGRYCEVTLTYGVEERKVLLVSIIEQLAEKSVVREVRGIGRCFIEEGDKRDKTIRVGTEGVNFRGVWQYDDIVDVNRITSNDVRAILTTYGVEAARMTIMAEIGKVFGVYGISVDPRHLSLIADYMTFEGGYRAMNRMGMESNVSPFQKMSFETTMHFLKSATISGDVDSLSSPSARLVVGKPVIGGTGSFDILQPLAV